MKRKLVKKKLQIEDKVPIPGKDEKLERKVLRELHDKVILNLYTHDMMA